MDRVICFDLDGTLVHSDDLHLAGFLAGLHQAKLPRVPAVLLKHLFGRPKRDIVRLITPGASMRQRDIVISVHDRVVSRRATTLVRPITGAAGALRTLAKSYTLALTSNCTHTNAERILAAAGLDRSLFSLIVGYTDVMRSKPFPDEIFSVQKALGLPVAWMVGDSIYDIRAAHAARVKSVAVLTGNYTREILKKEQPTKILDSVQELPGVLAHGR